MKLLVVLSVKEYQEKVASLLHNAGVKRFSVVDITGYKKRSASLSSGWFAANASTAKTNSIMLFSFVAKDIAEDAIAVIDTCNVESENPFPVHAYILDIENFSTLI